MATAQHYRVKPDPRGRITLTKSIEALNRRLSTAVTGFEVWLNEDASLTLKPTVEMPAESAIMLSRSDWPHFLAIIEDRAEPNATLRRAAAETAQDRVREPNEDSPPCTPLRREPRGR